MSSAPVNAGEGILVAVQRASSRPSTPNRRRAL